MKGQGKRVFRGLARERKRGKGKTGVTPDEGRGIVPPGSLNSPAAPPRIEGFRQQQLNMSEAPFKTPASYEAALEELDQLVGLIESGQLPLEQLLTGYQRGAQLLQFCRDKLQAVENQIKVLDEGTLKPWTQE